MLSLLLAALACFVPCVEPALQREDPPPAKAPALVLVPGTRVRLAAPPGFVQGEGFLGYSWPETGASLIVIEMPGSFAEVKQGFDKTGLERGGMKLIERKVTKVCGRDGLLVFAAQDAQGRPYRKWLAVCGDERRSVLLNAVFPAAHEADLSATFKAVLLGAEWDPKLSIDPFAILPWSIAAPEGLRFAGNLGQALMYTENGEIVQKDRPSSPRLVVAPSMGVAPIAEARAFAESRVRELPGMKQIEIVRSEPFEASGRRGWEITGKARDPEMKLEVCVHQVLLVGEEDYILFVGQVGIGGCDEWVPRFRASAKSWKRKDGPR